MPTMNARGNLKYTGLHLKIKSMKVKKSFKRSRKSIRKKWQKYMKKIIVSS